MKLALLRLYTPLTGKNGARFEIDKINYRYHVGLFKKGVKIKMVAVLLSWQPKIYKKGQNLLLASTFFMEKL